MAVRTAPVKFWRRRDDLAEVASDGRSAILRLDKLETPPLILEDSAAVIWQLIDGPTTRERLVGAVASAYGESPESVGGVVDEFLKDLVRADLVVCDVVAQVRVTALGVPVTVEVSGDAGASLVSALENAWRSVLDDNEDVRAGQINVQLRLDDVVDLPALMERATQEITAQAVGALAGSHLLLHACAVASSRTGAVVAFVGPSGMGKTTLAAALGKRWGYVTDETVAVDANGRVTPYPKPLSVIETAGAAKAQRSPTELGLLAAQADLTLAAIVLLDRRMEVADPETGLVVELVPTVDGVAHLAGHSSYLTVLDQPMQMIASVLNRTGGLRHARYTDTEDLVPLVTELIGGPEAEA